MPPPLILASTSPYRAELLQRLGLDFATADPRTDEAARDGEAPRDRAERLADGQAAALAAVHPASVVIGSDQVAELDGTVLHKPGSLDAAIAQLQACSACRVSFHTAVAVHHGADTRYRALDTTVVRFRRLDAETIRRYVAAEPAPDCCGGFKVEGLGVTLFDAVESTDPTALVGLPLIATSRLLRGLGYALP